MKCSAVGILPPCQGKTVLSYEDVAELWKSDLAWSFFLFFYLLQLKWHISQICQSGFPVKTQLQGSVSGHERTSAVVLISCLIEIQRCASSANFFCPFLSLKEKQSFPHMFVSKQNHWFSLKVFNFLSHSWPSLSLKGVLQVSLSTELCAEFTRCLFRWDLRILPSSEHPSMPI